MIEEIKPAVSQSYSALRRPDLSRVLLPHKEQAPQLQRANSYRSEKVDFISLAGSGPGQQVGFGSSFSAAAASNGGILEQAWMMKMATEIARKVASEKAREAGGAAAAAAAGGGFWDGEQIPPPAYAA